MTDKTSKELKPCPFCGADYTWLRVFTWTVTGRYYVFCDKCKCDGPPSLYKEKAVERWNNALRNHSEPMVVVEEKEAEECE